MKKLIIIAISMIAGWACAYAAEPNGLEVTLCDGATATVLFDANPELSFTGSKLVVTLPDRDGRHTSWTRWRASSSKPWPAPRTSSPMPSPCKPRLPA
ncbi:MAG: hypothetical protein ACI306_06500 [Muribaculaceae bacterium]